MAVKNKLLVTGAALLMGTGVTLGVHSIAHADANDVQINASQYTQKAQDLQKVFNNNNKDYTLSKITVENNQDHKQDPVYKLVGFDSKNDKVAKLKVAANNTNDVIKNKTEKVKKHHLKKLTALDINNIKQDPTAAINAAKKFANTNDNPSEWTLVTTKKDKKQMTYYVVKFTNKNKETTVKVNAQDGSKIAVKTSNED
ncbi:MAG: hypothetical protein H9901_02585 [Candidatus Paralactobacillus gallistercoris]|uniref:Peptidase propeptide and YPEB domain protein n=1 Tax=Candidatus Paralactobacillus gallistercoris TaxID=2838724 RepID=A0A948X2Z7_9LACO|nr:hypothetical protein [Candidatus Paralactobacillus gallistercoris]